MRVGLTRVILIDEVRLISTECCCQGSLRYVILYYKWHEPTIVNSVGKHNVKYYFPIILIISAIGVLYAIVHNLFSRLIEFPR